MRGDPPLFGPILPGVGILGSFGSTAGGVLAQGVSRATLEKLLEGGVAIALVIATYALSTQEDNTLYQFTGPDGSFKNGPSDRDFDGVSVAVASK